MQSNMLFSGEFTPLRQKFYTAVGSDVSDKYHLWQRTILSYDKKTQLIIFNVRFDLFWFSWFIMSGECIEYMFRTHFHCEDDNYYHIYCQVFNNI